MARPREFDTDAALSGAMDVFWTCGYEGATLPALLDGMGIGRGSMYKAFEDKKSLFLIVLARYDEEAVSPAVDLLVASDVANGWQRITKLFAMVIRSVRNGDRRGCLMCSAAAGPASDDQDIAQAVHRSLDRMRKGFGQALDASPHHANLDRTARRTLADTLTTQYVGLRVLARSEASLATLERSVSGLAHLSGDPI